MHAETELPGQTAHVSIHPIFVWLDFIHTNIERESLLSLLQEKDNVVFFPPPVVIAFCFTAGTLAARDDDCIRFH